MSGAQLQGPTPQFCAGQGVTVASRDSLGHCRTPAYLRGQSGIVVEVTGRFRDPELLAYHKPGLPQRYLYRVRFKQADLWPDYAGAAGDNLEADIFEHWLQPTTEENTI